VNSPRILTVGSLNMDLVTRVPRLPHGGETIGGTGFARIPGGKGANQAVAAARLGAWSLLCGRVGDDDDGRALLESLAADGVDTLGVIVTPDVPTGVASILVSDDGENAIAVVPGANGRLEPADIRAFAGTFPSVDCVLVQLEIPLETVREVLRVAREYGVPVILDPAPVPGGGLPDEMGCVDLLTPNQTEARQLTGESTDDEEGATCAAGILRALGARRVVVKMGALGALAIDERGKVLFFPAFPVEAVDTTAAGDAFNAALGVALAEGRVFDEAVRFACAAGALAASARGAQPGMPRRAEVERLFLSI
jgi:ribokinase